MRRFFHAMLATMILLTMPVGTSLADGQAVVISETLTIREQPNTGATARAQSVNGDMLSILGEQPNWYHVRFDDAQTGAHGEGYALKRFLVVNPEYATAIGATYVYAMPTASAKMVGEVEGGTQLVVLGEWGDFWAVNLRTASGFVRKDDVDYSGQTVQPTHRPQPTATPGPIIATTYIVIRDTALRPQPSSAAPSNGTMVAGSYVSIGAIRDGYGQNIDNGYWLAMADLQHPSVGGWMPPVETSEPGVYTYLVLHDGTNVYAEPNSASAVVDTLNNGDSVYVTSTQGGFGMVSYGRQRGWVSMDDLLSFHR